MKSRQLLPVKEYWEEDFLNRYGSILETLDALGMWAIFCDDMNYPSGSAGGVLAKKHPGLCARQLYKTEWKVSGSAAFEAAVPEGVLQGCVAMDESDLPEVLRPLPRPFRDHDQKLLLRRHRHLPGQARSRMWTGNEPPAGPTG